MISLGTLYSIYVILSTSMELVYGELGLPDFAKAAFFAIGAFAVGALTTRLGAALSGIAWEGEFKLHSYYYATLVSAKVAANPLLGLTLFLVPLTVAVPLAMFLGVIASYPALRLREDYLAITPVSYTHLTLPTNREV